MNFRWVSHGLLKTTPHPNEKVAVIMKRKLVIWGASGHALVVADIIRLQSEYEIVGFLDDVNLERHGTEFCGLPILGGKEQLDNLQQMGVQYLIFGFGDCEARLRLAALVGAKGFYLGTAIHPRATIAADVPIGSGTVIKPGAVIDPGSRIGGNAIINSCASCSHECVIEECAHVGPGVRLGGRVTVGRATWVGIGAVVKEGLRIGKSSLIGAGSVVLNDIPDGVVAYGVPARVIGENAPHHAKGHNCSRPA